MAPRPTAKMTLASMTRPAILRAVSLALLLAGCNILQNRAEFAAPQSRWPASLPATSAVDAPPPPIGARYCYRTLAAVDCFSEAKPDRVTAYTGLYPEPDAAAPRR
jgi:hypothetical protein